MGLCGSSLTEAEKIALNNSTSLDKDLLAEHRNEERIVKLLLLGPGESGKSTIFKQMQIIYDSGFSQFDKTVFRGVIRRNVVEAMQTLIEATKTFGFHMQNPASAQWAQWMSLLDAHSPDVWKPTVVDGVKALWEYTPEIRSAYQKRSQLQLFDSAAYFFKNVERIGSENYTPTSDDILRARLRTSGIVEKLMKVHDVHFRFLDVGGQRAERRKWIHCFGGVMSIIFVAAISEYDQVLYEDKNVNRLREAVSVFDDICNKPCFEDTAMIVFFNKIDLFQEKLPQSPLREIFKEYKGNNQYEDAAKFIEKMFLNVNHTEKMIFTHLTCATDTQNVQRVFDACKAVILKDSINHLGLQ